VVPSTRNVKSIHAWLETKIEFPYQELVSSRIGRYFQGFGEWDCFWQAKYYAFEIEERNKLEEKLQYMHDNPVRRGLVKHTTDWPWSSACWYELHRSVGVPIKWVE
jgi:putative transposase